MASTNAEPQAKAVVKSENDIRAEHSYFKEALCVIADTSKDSDIARLARQTLKLFDYTPNHL